MLSHMCLPIPSSSPNSSASSPPPQASVPVGPSLICLLWGFPAHPRCGESGQDSGGIQSHHPGSPAPAAHSGHHWGWLPLCFCSPFSSAAFFHLLCGTCVSLPLRPSLCFLRTSFSAGVFPRAEPRPSSFSASPVLGLICLPWWFFSAPQPGVCVSLPCLSCSLSLPSFAGLADPWPLGSSRSRSWAPVSVAASFPWALGSVLERTPRVGLVGLSGGEPSEQWG